MDAHVAVGVDLQHPLAHDVDLVLADGLARGDDLAVEIRQADLVVVDQIERAHAAADEPLTDIAAHAADAEHGHARTLQLLHGLRTEQKLRSRKLIEHKSLCSITYKIYRLIIRIRAEPVKGFAAFLGRFLKINRDIWPVFV